MRDGGLIRVSKSSSIHHHGSEMGDTFFLRHLRLGTGMVEGLDGGSSKSAVNKILDN